MRRSKAYRGSWSKATLAKRKRAASRAKSIRKKKEEFDMYVSKVVDKVTSMNVSKKTVYPFRLPDKIIEAVNAHPYMVTHGLVAVKL